MKRKKSFAVISLMLIFLLLTFAGCGASKGTDKSASTGKKVKVALVLTGLLGDNSFNDLCNKGVQKAKEEFDIELKVLESKDPSDWESNLISMADAGYDLVICSSTQLMDALKKHASEFKDTKFGIIDGIVDEPNVVSAVFAQNQGSFLVGAAAAMFSKMTDVPGVNGEKIIGAVGGMDIPVINDFMVGFKEGAEYIDADTKVLISYAGTFNDPLKGKELALAQFSQGADVVYNVAAGTGKGILEAANDEGKYAIGVDVNQDDTYPGHVLISSIKYVDVATYTMVKQVAEGTWKGGETIRLDINSNGVGASDMSVLKEALGDKFPEEIPKKLKAIVEDMKSGKIKVSHAEGFEF